MNVEDRPVTLETLRYLAEQAIERVEEVPTINRFLEALAATAYAHQCAECGGVTDTVDLIADPAAGSDKRIRVCPQCFDDIWAVCPGCQRSIRKAHADVCEVCEDMDDTDLHWCSDCYADHRHGSPIR